MSEIFFRGKYRLTPEQEREYIEAAKNGDADAREKLIRNNLPLVAQIVKIYSNGEKVDELISMGSIGLIKGANTLERSDGESLTAYFAKCIEDEILGFIAARKTAEEAAERNFDEALKWHERAQNVAKKLAEYESGSEIKDERD